MIQRTSLHAMHTAPLSSPFFLGTLTHESPPLCTTEFEFIKPTFLLNRTFHKPPDDDDDDDDDEEEAEEEDRHPSPADELFYKGQLLPLSLPSRIRMVEDLRSSDARAGTQERVDNKPQLSLPQLSYTKEADPGGNLSLYLRRKRDMRKGRVASDHDPPSPCSFKVSEHNSNGKSVQEADQVSSISCCTELKPKERWGMFCCHYAKTRSTSRNGALYLCSLQNDSSLLNPQSPRPASSIPSMSLSSSFTSSMFSSPTSSMTLSSSASSMPRSTAENSSSHREKMPTKATRSVDSTTREQKGSLVGKARYCLRKSFKALKLGRGLRQTGNHQEQRESPRTQEDDYESYVPNTAPRHRSQVAHYEHIFGETGNGDVGDIHSGGHDEAAMQESISQSKEGNGGDKPNIQQQKSCLQLPKKVKDRGANPAVCWEVSIEKNDGADDFIKREWSWTTSFDENESFSAAFITIEPSQGFGTPCNGARGWMCGSRQATTGAEVEIESHIQGAIAHCKKSSTNEHDEGERVKF